MRRLSWLFAAALLVLFALPSRAVIAAGPGDLDTSFDGDGIVITSDTSVVEEMRELSLQDDGRIVMAGHCGTGNHQDICLRRYTAAGAPDTTFDGDGRAVLSLGEGFEGAEAVEVQSDGKILLGGRCAVGVDANPCLVRYKTDGTLDGGFGSGGIVVPQSKPGSEVLFPSIYHLVLQPDHKIVAVGQCNQHHCLARFTESGALDQAFGSGGIAELPVPDYGLFRWAALQADGKIVAAGTCSDDSPVGQEPDICVVRFQSNGTPDASFGVDGIVQIVRPDNDESVVVIVQPDGKIFVTAHCGKPACLVRLDSTGELDASFGTGGIATTAIMQAESAALQTDSKYVLVGYCLPVVDDIDPFCLMRYTSAGQPDPTFGEGGLVQVTMGSFTNYGIDIGLQPDGRIVVGGSCSGDADQLTLFPCLARLNGDLDSDLDGYTDEREVQLGTDPHTPCSIMRADVDGDGTISIFDVAFVAAEFLEPMPPANPRYDQDGSHSISILDMGSVASQFLAKVSSCPQ